MHRPTARFLVALVSLWSVTFDLAAAPVIGVAVARGSFHIDNNPVVGNATLFDGNTLETRGVPSELQLYSGVRILLAADSRGKIYRDRLVLEKGMGELEVGSGYRIEARGLRIFPTAPDSAARVGLSERRRVQVATLSGVFRVTTAGGRAVAIVVPGMALEFAPQVPGGQATFTMTGCLERRDAVSQEGVVRLVTHYVLRDLVAGVVEELRGQGLDRYVGDVVEVTASDLPNVKPVTGAEEVILVNRIRRIRRGCPAAPPGAVPPAAPKAPPPAEPAPPTPEPAPPTPEPTPPPAQPAPPPQVPPTERGGMSGTAKVIIAGVAVGGAGAGAAVLLRKKGEEKPTISP